MTARMTKVNSKGNRVSDGLDYVNYVRATERYTSYVTGDRSMSRWVGTCSGMLALKGDVDGDTLAKLAQGYDALGRELVQGAGTKKHYNGIDITLSPPKSVSVAFLLETEERRAKILDCHERAVDAVVRFIEEQKIVQVNRGSGGIIKLESDGITAASFTHLASRSLDPQIHAHLFALNITRGRDGQWSCMENQELFRYQMAIGAVYRSVVARELKTSLGYGIRQTIGIDGYGDEDGKDAFEIEGFCGELLEHFSTRSKEVEEYKKLHPHAHNAGVATRKRKDEPTWEELDADWKVRVDFLREKHPEWLPNMASLVGQPDRYRVRTQDEMLEQLHETEACITRPNLLARLAMDHVGDSMDEILAREDAFSNDPSINHVAPERQAGDAKDHSPSPALIHTERRYAASWMVEMEQDIHDWIRQANDNHSHAAQSHVVNHGINVYEKRMQKELKNPEFRLKDEQRKMVEHCTMGSNISFVVGWAGTGKTTASSAMTEVFKLHQVDGEKLELLGAAPSWKAAGKLSQEIKLPCKAIASIATAIEMGTYIPSKNTVLMIDEASLMGSRSFHTLMGAMQKAGGKVVVFGDPHQLQSVEAGSPYRAGIDICGAAYLNEISRQKTKTGLDIAYATYQGFDDKKGSRSWRQSKVIGQDIYQKLDDAGWVFKSEDDKEKIEGLVKMYARDGLDVSQKIAIAPTNYEVGELNRQIRETLKMAGKVSMDEHTVSVQSKSGRQDIQVSVGDRLRFKDKYDDKANNQEDCTVEHISRNRHTGALELQVVMDDKTVQGKERRFTIDTLEFDCYTHAYAMTVYGSQGQTVGKRVYLMTDSRADQHLTTVALTRSREETFVFIDEDEAENIAKAMGKHRLKDNVLEEGLIIKAARKKEPVQAQQPILQQAVESKPTQTMEELRASIKAQTEAKQAQQPSVPPTMAEHFKQVREAEVKRGRGRGR